MIQAVLFDMDGLLVDSEPVWYDARRDLLREHGRVWTETDQRAMAGVHTAVWVEALYEKLEGTLARGVVEEEIVARMESRYRGGDVPVLAGAHEAIDTCAARYRLGLASGSPQRLIDAVLRGAGWQGRFERLLSTDELEHGKPAPDVYLEICRRLGVAPARCVVVEDSGAGIRAGKAAGAKVVAVPNPHTDPGREVLALADATIETLHELGVLLASIDEDDAERSPPT
ncbi:MAG TPA: HAD family phosphatase [Thermoanaerobaculia bacterium]|nr:HAD family phosphatase [Thermoanaerobaculia bacterium]